MFPGLGDDGAWLPRWVSGFIPVSVPLQRLEHGRLDRAEPTTRCWQQVAAVAVETVGEARVVPDLVAA